MRHIGPVLIAMLLLVSVGCRPSANEAASAQPQVSAPQPAASMTLTAARQGFITRIVSSGDPGRPAPVPPPGDFSLIRYRSPAGELAAHLTKDPGDGAKHPAIVWITGLDCNSIWDNWIEGSADNEQSAAAYRKAGLVMMFPSLRGGNDNPGKREGFYGEVEDVLAAADHLAGLSYVDPERIYLGGHSTGGTLVMLVAELSTKFRAAFAFGPVADVRDYEGRFTYHDPNNAQEAELRAPGRWLDSVQRPLFVFEGTGGNFEDLQAMQSSNRNPMIKFFGITGRDHFDLLAPVNELIAAKLVVDRGAALSIDVSAAELEVLALR